MRIATWNLERPRAAAGERWARQHVCIEAVAANVWILTESHVDVSPGPGFHGVWSEPTDGQVWSAIWSPHSITSLGATRDPTNSVAALVQPKNARPVVVYGTVLPWLGREWNGFSSSGGVAFEQALAAQLEDWRDLRQQHPDCELVVAGDLNQDLAPSHYYGSTRNRDALRQALAEVGLRCLTAGDRDPVWKQTGGVHAAIDHICVTAGLIAAPNHIRAWPGGGAPDRKLSDHFGVSVDVRAGRHVGQTS